MGLHAYDGHIRDSDFAVKTKNCDAAYSLVKDLQEKIMATGFARPTIIMGGSPSFSVHCKRLDIECSPGTFIYWDRGYQVLCPEQPFLPAALVITRIISIPAPDRICTDLGHKSIAPENEIERRVYFLNAPELKLMSQSEEHGLIGVVDSHAYRTGEILYGVPLHVCPTIALYDKAITIENGKTSGEWKTVARDRSITL
jgi:D-serine deaminase-like pyridoxal phosphate-dependent protein